MQNYYSFWNVNGPVFTDGTPDRFIAFSQTMLSQINRASMNVRLPGTITSIEGQPGSGCSFAADYICSHLSSLNYETLPFLVTINNDGNEFLKKVRRHFAFSDLSKDGVETPYLIWARILDELEIENRFLVIRLHCIQRPKEIQSLRNAIDQLAELQSFSPPRISLLIENPCVGMVSDNTRRRMGYSWYRYKPALLNQVAVKSYVETSLMRKKLISSPFSEEQLDKITNTCHGLIKPISKMLEACLMTLAAFNSKNLEDSMLEEIIESQRSCSILLMHTTWKIGVGAGNSDLSIATPPPIRIMYTEEIKEILDYSNDMLKTKEEHSLEKKRAKKPFKSKDRISASSIEMDAILDLDD